MKKIVYLSSIMFLFCMNIHCQRALRIMFYNTENLFDTINDPKTNDDEFTPSGRLHWNSKRYYTKIQNTYKVIRALGEWSPPDIIGLCEIENRSVLNDLVKKTPLVETEYKISHFDSPDSRGIDVAILYRTQYLKLINEKPIYIKFPAKYDNTQTRNILLTQFIYNNTDTFWVFVNHWPSRRGSGSESNEMRCIVAQTLKKQTDSILIKSPKAKIVIMGDFNDEPSDASISKCLEALPAKENTIISNLNNLSTNYLNAFNTGTIKFQGSWMTFDQIIVSKELLLTRQGLYATSQSSKVFNPSFLLFNDSKYLGYKPNRTYVGPKYTGGYSDHLPVFVDLLIKK